MTANELWQKFVNENKLDGIDFEAWSFGVEPDLLAQLVVTGHKTGTSSLHLLYEMSNEPLPSINEYSIILDSNDNAVCVIKNINVEVIPFNEVTSVHAYKEGEGDKSLNYWRRIHKEFFTKCLSQIGIEFTEDMKVVYEEFEVVLKL